jgi:prepilin-type N-terminal cleavage/methylation domain-containing protein
MQDRRTDNSNGGHWKPRLYGCAGFTLLEVLTALAVLAFVSSSVLVVIDRCIVAAADSTLRMEAFTLVRENMEKILASNSVSETVDYGISDTNANISWQTAIEAFSEPVDGTMWVRAVCSAEFKDTAGETQTVKLEHWLAELTQQQADQLAGQEDLEQLAVEQLIETPEEAAQYAGVSAETIEQWVENGLLTTDDGLFIKYNLDIYKRSQGEPSEQDKAEQVESIEDLALSLRSSQEGQAERSGAEQGSDGIDPLTGLSYEELEKKDVREVMELLQKRQK